MSGEIDPVEPPKLPSLDNLSRYDRSGVFPAPARRPIGGERFDPANEREKRSQEVLRRACETGQAAELLDALTSGGAYGYNNVTRELVIRPRYYRSEPPRDAVSVTMTNHTAKVVALAVIDPEGSSEVDKETARALFEKVFLLAGRESPADDIAWEIEGTEGNEIEDTLTFGVVAITMIDHMRRARDEYHRLALLYGVKPDIPKT
jgi:hypothetical protein